MQRVCVVLYLHHNEGLFRRCCSTKFALLKTLPQPEAVMRVCFLFCTQKTAALQKAALRIVPCLKIKKGCP
jgi:hypothetical protein